MKEACKKIKKGSAVCLAFIMALMVTTGLSAYAADFTDLDDTYANARTAIQKWAGYGVVSGIGDGRFGPQLPFRRYQMAVMLDRIMGYTETVDNRFTDLEGNPYAPYILRCTAAGVFTHSGAFRPDDYITREETALAFARALGVTYKAVDTTRSTFVDDADIALVARGAIKAMVARGLLSGLPEGNGQYAFRPKEPIKRQDMVTLFSMALDALVNRPGKSAASNKTHERSVVINAPGAILDNAVIAGDLIIAEGVGEGDVTLNNVTVIGRLLIKAGGEHSVHILGRSQIADVRIDKRSDKRVSLNVSGNTRIQDMRVNRGRAVLTGANNESPTLAHVQVETNGASLTVEEHVNVNQVTISRTAEGATVNINGTVHTLNIEGGAASVEIGGVVVSLHVTNDNVALHVSGEVSELVLDAANVDLNVSGTVAKVTVTETAANAVVTVAENATVAYMQVSAEKLVVNGEVGIIGVTENVTEKPVNNSGNNIHVVLLVTDETGTVLPPPLVPTGGGGGSGGGTTAASPSPTPGSETTPPPTIPPTAPPTAPPTPMPTTTPTPMPTTTPTATPTEPTEEPTTEPTEAPTAEPTEEPTTEPTAEPTEEPTTEPTAEPTEEPTTEPTAEPTEEPTTEPTAEPINAATPVIDTQPLGATVSAAVPGGTGNTTHALTVAAHTTDSGSLHYQWYSNTTPSNDGGTVIAGATGATYDAPIDVSGTYYYYVVVTNILADNGDGGQKTAAKTSVVAMLIVETLTVANATIANIADVTYTAAAHTPTPTVTLDGHTLTAASDFDYSYSNNILVGSATVTITGKSPYTGTQSVTFNIQPANLNANGVTFLKPANKPYGESFLGTTVTVDTGHVVIEGTDTTIPGTWTITNAGTETGSVGDKTATATFTPDEGAANFNAPLTKTLTVTIVKASGVAVEFPTDAANNATVTSSTITVPFAVATVTSSQPIEYGITTDSSTEPAAWQSSSSFSELMEDTTYYVWARSAFTAFYEAGTPVYITVATIESNLTQALAAAENAIADLFEDYNNGKNEIVTDLSLEALSGAQDKLDNAAELDEQDQHTATLNNLAADLYRAKQLHMKAYITAHVHTINEALTNAQVGQYAQLVVTDLPLVTVEILDTAGKADTVQCSAVANALIKTIEIVGQYQGSGGISSYTIEDAGGTRYSDTNNRDLFPNDGDTIGALHIAIAVAKALKVLPSNVTGPSATIWAVSNYLGGTGANSFLVQLGQQWSPFESNRVFVVTRDDDENEIYTFEFTFTGVNALVGA